MIQIKFFIGIRLTPELKLQMREFSSPSLKQIPYEGRDYLGFFLNAPHPSTQEIRQHSTQLIEELQFSFPNQRCDTMQFLIFPQIFLG